MIYICYHTQPAYAMHGAMLIDNTKSSLPEEYGHIRGIEIVSKMKDLPDEIGIYQQRRYIPTYSIPTNCDVVVPHNFCICTMRDQYAACHGAAGIELIESIVNDELFSKYIRLQHNFECYWDNMFIMRREPFLEYADFVITTLKKKDEISGPWQNRWIAERLGSFWIWKTFQRSKIYIGDRIQIG